MKITREYLDGIDWLEHDTGNETWIRDAINNPDFVDYVSTDGMLRINNLSNLSQDAWNIHLDNEDCDTIASFDVETVEEANVILNIYNKYILNQFNL
jgi:hypothetical protein